MKLSTLFEQSLIDKCLLLYPWAESRWRRNSDNVALLIIDIPRTITIDQFIELCNVSGKADWGRWLWKLLLSDVQEDEIVVHVTWKQVVDEMTATDNLDNDFEG